MARLKTNPEAPDALAPWQREVLLFGQPLLNVRGLTFREATAWRDMPAARAAWRRWRRVLMAEFSGRPGERPWGWWVFERGLEYPAGPGHRRFLRLCELAVLADAEIEAYYTKRPWFKKEAKGKTDDEEQGRIEGTLTIQ